MGRTDQAGHRPPAVRQASRSLIHERDVAEVIAHLLTSDGHREARYLITGPESIPQAELVTIIGDAVGRGVRWEEPPLDHAREELTEAWGDAALVAARLRAWADLVDCPERVTDTVERLGGTTGLDLSRMGAGSC